jgi:predicted PurR-regulated permease PerM
MELRARIAQQWTQTRAEARAARRAADELPEIGSGPSNFKRAQVPYGVDLAAAWGWRFLVICAAGLVVLYLLRTFAVLVLPLVVALLLAALTAPLVNRLQRLGLPRSVSALAVVVALLGGVGTVITFVGTSIADGFVDLNEQVADGLGEIRAWLRDGPLGVTDSQFDTMLSEGQRQLTAFGEDLVGHVTEVGAALGDIVAGVFIVLFSLFFFLYDGQRIWAWVVRLFPRAARSRANSSGRVAWSSLTQFVRATVVVAGVDAVLIATGAAILGVPFVGAIAVLVFLGGFVPLVGATVSGGVAVLVALVAQGPAVALLMLAVVVGVQQVEAHVLQPFLLGRFVSVHPLAIIVVITMGLLVAGVAGALVAVPLAASLNAVVQHLAQETDVGEDPVEAVDDEIAPEAT